VIKLFLIAVRITMKVMKMTTKAIKTRVQEKTSKPGKAEIPPPKTASKPVSSGV